MSSDSLRNDEENLKVDDVFCCCCCCFGGFVFVLVFVLFIVFCFFYQLFSCCIEFWKVHFTTARNCCLALCEPSHCRACRHSLQRGCDTSGLSLLPPVLFLNSFLLFMTASELCHQLLKSKQKPSSNWSFIDNLTKGFGLFFLLPRLSSVMQNTWLLPLFPSINN